MPTKTPYRLLAPLIFLMLTVASLPAAASLPLGVDGQPLPSLAPMLKKVTPAVVNISSRHRARAHDPFLDDPFFRRFFGLPAQPRDRVRQALGSGVIINADKGYIITNNHVIADADAITVALQDGRKFQATVVGTDPATDIAVIRIDAPRLMSLPASDSSTLQVGDFVVAVGEPFGFGQTVTTGIVSALGRSGLGNTYQNFIQTDASINPGNSGGALVNLAGELVGINSMIYSPTGASAGIGFAIPSNLALSVARQLIAHGHVQRGTLGVQTQDVTPRIAHALGLDEASGAVVTRMTTPSAEQAGLHEGDVIIAINGQPVTDTDQLNNAEGLLPLGKPVHLTVMRQDEKLQLEMQLTPDNPAQTEGDQIDPRLGGATLRDLSRHQRNNGLHGVRVIDCKPESRAAINGLQADDRIIAVGRLGINNLQDLRRALRDPPQHLVLTIVRQHQARYLRMR